MHRSLPLLLLVALPQTSSFLWGGGCCGAPVIASPCCGGATSWAYAPPQIIGYERIPLYAKVPMPAPQTYLVRSRPPPAPVVQAQPYYAPPPPPPPPSSYYAPAPEPMPRDNYAPGPSSVSPQMSQVIPPPQDKYDDGDVIVIETDDARRRRMSSSSQHHNVQPPPSGYASQPVGPQGYGLAPQMPQQQPISGQVENGIEVTPDQIASGYQPQQTPSADSAAGLVESVASSAAYEATGVAPSARRLRKFLN